MIGAQLHSLVNISHACGAVSINADCFVDHRDQDSVYHKTGSFLYLNGSLADLYCDSFDLLNHLIRRILTRNYLNQLHSVGRVEEVHTDHGPVKTCADLCDGQGRGVGCKHALRLNDTH